MSIPKHTFNTLPAKPEHITKVLKVLESDSEFSEREIVSLSGLTKTQALCAIAELMKNGSVSKSERTRGYVLTQKANR